MTNTNRNIQTKVQKQERITVNLRYSDMDDAHKPMAIMEVVAIARWKLH